MECKQKLKEVAAKTLGGAAGGLRSGQSARVAQRRRRGDELGAGGAEGHRAGRHLRRPRGASDDVHKRPSRRWRRWPGRGWWFRRRTSIRTTATRIPIVASFAEVEVDVETGKYYITDFLAYARCGHGAASALAGRADAGALDAGHRATPSGRSGCIDPQYGITVAKRFYQNKPPTILDVPVDMQWNALNIPDPETPVGARGVRRAAGGRRMRGDSECAGRCAGRRDLPARAGECGHDSGVVRSGTADAASVDGDI